MADSSRPPNGATLAGKYRVERILGQGGMGVVVQATHIQLQQHVAMKFLLPEVLGNSEVVQRFLREAQAAVQLRSEHVARVIDVGTLETGAPYMVLEYLEGADLAHFPRAQLTVGTIVDLLLQACEALAEAQSLGIVHRDIKPANLFITRRVDGSLLLKVLDFGISKLPLKSGQLTATQTVMGTPAYMSPEQIRSSRSVDQRSDIWSLGIVLYKLLQGVPPYEGDTFPSLVLKVVNDPLPKLTVPLPSGLDALVYRCLEKDPARRFQNAAELAHAMAKFAESRTQATVSVQRTRAILGPDSGRLDAEPDISLHVAPSTLSSAVSARMVAQRLARRWPVFAIVGLVLGAISAAAFTVSRGFTKTNHSSSGRPEPPAILTPPPDPQVTSPIAHGPDGRSSAVPPSLISQTPPPSAVSSTQAEPPPVNKQEAAPAVAGATSDPVKPSAPPPAPAQQQVNASKQTTTAPNGGTANRPKRTAPPAATKNVSNQDDILDERN